MHHLQFYLHHPLLIPCYTAITCYYSICNIYGRTCFNGEEVELEVTAELVERTQSEYFDQSPFVFELMVTSVREVINDNPIDEPTFRNLVVPYDMQ